MTIGVLPTIAPYLLPRVMAAFTKKFPGVQIVVHEDTTARLHKLALAWEIDFALASRPIRDGRLEVRGLFSEELLVALPPGHPLIRKRTLGANDLVGERLIVMQEGHWLLLFGHIWPATGTATSGVSDSPRLQHHPLEPGRHGALGRFRCEPG